MSDVVVVESPAKAKTINTYLGDGYTVLASFGHVRDLPPKDGSVRPDQDFAMDWEADAARRQAGRRHRQGPEGRQAPSISPPTRIARARRSPGTSAPCWQDKNALKGVDVHRITFNEITRNAVRYAMAHPRELDQPLIEAYWPAARSTTWWASPSPRCCGASCRAAAAPAACSPSRCA